MKTLAAVSALLVACAAGPMASPALGAAKKAATRAPSVPSHAVRTAVPFVEDDYSRALAEARKRDVPVFIDAWAPW